MCTPWKTKRFGSSFIATMPLQRRMFGPCSWVMRLIHGMNLFGIDVAVEPHRHRLHVLVVIVLQPVMLMVVVVIVVVIVVVVLGDQEIRLDVEDAVEIEGAPLEHVGDRDVALLRAVQRA